MAELELDNEFSMGGTPTDNEQALTMGHKLLLKMIEKVYDFQPKSRSPLVEAQMSIYAHGRLAFQLEDNSYWPAITKALVNVLDKYPLTGAA